MIKLPEFKEPLQPTDSKVINLKNSTLFVISIVAEIVSIIGSILAFKSLDNKMIIIIILAITCLILFIDVIVLYLKDRENYFKNIYLTNMYRLLTDNIKELQDKSASLDKTISDIKLKTS